jgi:hypothetical protein
MSRINEKELEQALRDKRKEAPRVRPGDLDANIKHAIYFNPTPTLTICVIECHNGYTVVGQSACASPENFDLEIGKTLAYEDARNHLWPLLGFHLKANLSVGLTPLKDLDKLVADEMKNAEIPGQLIEADRKTGQQSSSPLSAPKKWPEIGPGET